MRRQFAIGAAAVLLQLLASAAFAGPWEDGMAAYNRGDYVPAIRLFRPLAQQGNAKAQNILGVMYRRGQGVARSVLSAHLWLGVAAAHGDNNARIALRDLSRTMSEGQLEQARAMAQSCEVSNYRQCEY